MRHNKMKKRSPQIRCGAFSGHMLDLPEIHVDNFNNHLKKAYFLSHCHEDHIKGLFSQEFVRYLEKSGAFIYMSEISAVIIDHWSCGKLKEYIKPLPLGTTTVVLPPDELDIIDERGETYMEVTLMPAGHCFGSVMFLFRTNDVTVLYTGDFRVNRDDICKYKQLHRHDEPIDIDVMYVDTTFQNKDYEDFPDRSESTDYAVEEIKKWFAEGNSENKYVGLHTSARLGYEFLFKELHRQLNMKIYIPHKDTWELYSKFTILQDFMTQDPSAKLHLCYDRCELANHEKCNLDTSGKTFLYAHFSAMMWKDCNLEEKMVDRRGNRLNVCYSTHCSRSELIAFVSYFSPKRVVGFSEPYQPVL